jgi:hypothetical protein
MLSAEGGAFTLIWRRRRDGRTQQYGWLAGGLLDEALRVFGALQAATYLDDGQLDDELRERFRVTALDVLDDVACLTPLVVWPSAPGRDATDHRGEPPALEAVRALATYSARLASIAEALAGRQDEAASVFVGLAAAAEARIEALAS